MITKTANAMITGLAKDIGKDLVHPLNLAFGAYSTTSGLQSLGGTVGMSAGGIAGSKLYNHLAQKKILPAIGNIAKRVPGKFGKFLSGAASVANSAGGFIAPLIGGTAGSELAEKYTPIYKRRNFAG